ncbi:MAG TPA: hypothetical protein VFU16_07455 [Solirubrobacterales bacterium]|nr:hypothetical protein [Solirubrobacterales bacterium]
MTTAGRTRAGSALAIFALALAALAAWASVAAASPPGNDAFANAEPLGEFAPAGIIGLNAEATKETGEPNHAGNPGGHSVWYSWTPKANWRVSVRTANACFGQLDALVAVYTGSAVDALTPVASNESPLGGCSFFSEPPQAEFEAAAGTTYWIAVDGRDGDEGAFELLLDPPPANDDFANATALDPEPPQNVFGTTRLADKETGEPAHAGDPGGNSVWYSWTPSENGTVDVSTCSGSSNIDAVLAVYTGSDVDALTPVAANDDGPAGESFIGGCNFTDSEVSVDVTAGTTYRIAVDAAGGEVGRFTLRIRGRSQNDDFASPRVLDPVLSTFVNQETNRLATKEGGEPDHAGDPGGHSLWYEWTPSSGGPVAISTCTHEGEVDTLLAVYTGSTVGGLTPVAANDDVDDGRCSDLNSEVRFTASAGTTYRIAVDGKAGAEGRFDLFIESPPGNDDFADAQTLGAGLPVFGSGSTWFAGKETGEPDHAGDPGGQSVWFAWTPSSSGQVAISICPFMESSPDTLLAVYTGSAVDALTPVAASDDSAAACKSTGSQVQLNVSAGTTYRIAVDAKDGGPGPFGLNISGPPANDDFEDASVLPDQPVNAFGSTVFADKQGGEPDHAGDPGGHSLWYEWTPSSSGAVAITACGRNADTDPLLAVYTGSAVNALTPVAASDDAPGEPEEEFCASAEGFSRVQMNVTAGTTYRIALDTKGGEGMVDLFFKLTPVNDDFADAQQLSAPLPSTASGDTDLASRESGEPNHAGNAGGHSVWFKWTPTQSGPVAVSTCSVFGDLDTLLAVYTGSTLGGLTAVANDDDGTGDRDCRGTDSEAQFTATAGVTYRIAVDGKAGSTGFFQLLLEGKAANDDFGKPQPLGGSLPTYSWSWNRFASKQGGEPDHAGGAGGSSVWFKWTAPRSGTVSVDTCESSVDTLLAVYTGTAVGSLTPVASNDEGSGKCAPQSKLTFEAVANTVYRIAVDGKAGAQGRLALYLEAGPDNDDFAASAVIGSLGWYLPGSTLLATKQSGEPNHAGNPGGHSVWYSWTPSKGGAVELDACTATFDPLLAVYTGSAVGGLAPVATADAGSGECEAGGSVRFDALAGATYRIAVDGAGGDAGRFQLHLRAAKATPPPPPDPGGGGTDGGGTQPPVVSPPPAVDPPATRKPKPLRCKRGFKKKLVKGKPRCVKKKKKKKRRR